MLYVIICLFQIEKRDKFADNLIVRKNIVIQRL